MNSLFFLKPLSDSNLVDGFLFVCVRTLCLELQDGLQHAYGFILLGILVACELSAGHCDCLMHPHAFDTLAWIMVSELSIAVATYIQCAID